MKHADKIIATTQSELNKIFTYVIAVYAIDIYARPMIFIFLNVYRFPIFQF